MKEIIIKKEQEGQRIDKFIRKYLNDAPLSFIYKLFRKKDIKVNGKRVDISYILKETDQISIYITEQQLAEFNKPKAVIKQKVNLNIIYEDDQVLIVDKPSGILVHGDEQEKRITLTNQVLNYLMNKGEYDPKKNVGFTPAPAHRLDRNTSGLVVFGKTIGALQELLDLFKDKKEIKKEYLALLVGNLRKDGIIDKPLLKNEKTGIVVVSSLDKGAKTAITKYSVVENLTNFTLVKAELITGRTHQLRVHFKSIGYPIIGDSKYGNFQQNKLFDQKFDYHNQFLHAYRLSFFEVGGVLKNLNGKVFVSPLPKRENQIIESLRK